MRGRSFQSINSMHAHAYVSVVFDKKKRMRKCICSRDRIAKARCDVHRACVLGETAQRDLGQEIRRNDWLSTRPSMLERSMMSKSCNRARKKDY